MVPLGCCASTAGIPRSASNAAVVDQDFFSSGGWYGGSAEIRTCTTFERGRGSDESSQQDGARGFHRCVVAPRSSWREKNVATLLAKEVVARRIRGCGETKFNAQPNAGQNICGKPKVRCGNSWPATEALRLPTTPASHPICC